ncbi:MAG: FixG Ig-like domain-containing protein, partial [Azospira sp.]
QPRRYTVQVAGLEGIRLSQPAQVSLAAASTGTLTLQIRVDAGSADKGAHPITLTVQDEADASIRVTEKTKFWMP